MLIVIHQNIAVNVDFSYACSDQSPSQGCGKSVYSVESNKSSVARKDFVYLFQPEPVSGRYAMQLHVESQDKL